jgi:3-dehydroquinate synthetase
MNLPPEALTAKGAAQARVRVQAPRPYDVLIAPGLLEGLGEFLREMGLLVPHRRLFLAHDAGLPAEIVETAAVSLHAAGGRLSRSAVEAGESAKTMAGAERLLVEMAASRHERRDCVVALGGGIVGDVAGFAAAIYRRGVPIVQCPTTLLAMVDAAVGGKTAVNLAVEGSLKKNLIGAFHQPRLVIADVSVLRTLPDRQFRCGLAECIKHGMIGVEFGEPALLEWIEAAAPALLARDEAKLVELVSRNVALKAAVVGLDEREEAEDGGRALLNLGHTFGHAVETVEGAIGEGTRAPGIHHGEAVALGLIAATRCAEESGACPRELKLTERVRALIQRCGLPRSAAGLPSDEELLARMAHDKKVMGGILRLVLPTGPGRAALFADPPRQAVLAGLQAIRAGGAAGC